MSSDTQFRSEPQLRFYMTVPHPCSYLADKEASTLFLDPEHPLNQSVYDLLSLVGFRRSGSHLYRPNCKGCNACISVRIPVNDFIFKRKYRKIAHRNSDLSWRIVPAQFSAEHYALYERYINERHADGDMYPPSEDQFRSFLNIDCEFTHLVEFREPSGQLVAVSAMDELSHGLSAIYTFYDPNLSRRSLGVYVVLWLLVYCRSIDSPYLYLGYWVESCKKMSYKTQYQPLEQLQDNHWQPLIITENE
ncbi:arginine-tRNA-protein transferase [Oceanospirillum multiglobuliferum]|uniref:Aspartate/glutamate leucyltransferase n=1 Tax=Oceanospirillum multiglobuliferum TaxID=64969 RepID=A0A1T4MGY2_9GAMM|nr:arginyltransferase [Oceanospirillum multiglobuliferum]OPX57022.1 arginyltransferase [Oceanospirillum multiglobuliferum]SJZ66350.1 arginine-tRNA-protein transferase [Oceanospirillum multiglobuliferum]